MKPKNSPSRGTSLSTSYALRFAMAAALITQAHSQVSNWQGMGSDNKWSTDANWDVTPINGESLIFDGTVGLANANDFITALDGIAFTFAANAGSFVISDGGAGPVTIGNNGASTALATLENTAPQEIALDLQLAGGNRDRYINFVEGSKLRLSGNVDSSNSWLFPAGGAGTLELTGDNSGPGNGTITAGTNNMRAFCRLNAAGQTIALGSPTALGETNQDFANLRGLRMNAGNQVLTTVDGMDLTGENKLDYTISWQESTSYVGAGDIEVGGLIYTKNNGRAWSVDGGGEFIISGHGIILTSRAEAQMMILQPLNGNVITVNGPIHDTYQSDGIVTQTAGNGGVLTDGILRLQGSGTINLNADNSSTMNAEVLLNGADVTVKLGNANALGTYGDPTETVTSVSVEKLASTYSAPEDLPNEVEVDNITDIAIGYLVTGPGIPEGAVVTAIDPEYNVVTMDMAATEEATGVTLTFSGEIVESDTPGRTNMNAGTLDLNGFAVNETFVNLATNHRFINSNMDTPAEVLSDIVGQGNPRFDGPGDLIFSNILHPSGLTRRMFKNGTGTLTLGGDVSNNRYGLTVDEGDVILAKTSGEAVSRFPLIINNADSTVTLVNTGEQINNANDANGLHQINAGTLDLNGFSESLAGLTTTSGTEAGGIVTNSNNASISTFTLLGVNATAAAENDVTWPGAITGNIALVKKGAEAQALTGPNSYTGSTSVEAGTLSLASATLADGANVMIAEFDAYLNLTHGLTDTVAGLIIGGVSQPAGVYGAIDSGAEYEIDQITGTGLLNVTAAGGNDYDSWASEFSLVGGPTDDDDNDGVSNEDEYAFGLNPTSGSSVNPITQQLDPSTGTFKYTRRNTAALSTGLSYSYEYSTTLSGSWTPFTPASETSDNGNPTETVTVTVPANLLSETKLFVRTQAD
ncbi:beta strand repeat-containing protein [Haloferula chungangensis]|uniref:Beta strand repeat-containing protein n=1 Tax=Haloferula chungangensis TaxID=1048331 RepID=A0ABW2L992_9BACT